MEKIYIWCEGVDRCECITSTDLYCIHKSFIKCMYIWVIPMVKKLMSQSLLKFQLMNKQLYLSTSAKKLRICMQIVSVMPYNVNIG